MLIRDLTTIEECQRVVEMQRAVWGFTDEDVVPAAMLILAVKRGGILAAAFDDDVMAGFVYSLPGLRGTRVVQWSHMLGVLEAYRRSGVGRQLKLAQRERALAMGLDLVEWTYDPLQAVNASLNLRRLRAMAGLYLEDLYGTSSSPLHRGTPTDRLIAEWWIRTPRVSEAISHPTREENGAGAGPPGRREAATEAREVTLNTMRRDGAWLVCDDIVLDADAPRLRIGIPRDFAALQRDAPAHALDWRLKTRALFTCYFAKGYRAVDFDLQGDRGFYLLTRDAG